MAAPGLPPPVSPAPPDQWAYPTDAQGEPKRSYVKWVLFGALGCFVMILVLGLIATLVVPPLVRKFTRAQSVRAKTDVLCLRITLDQYAKSHGGQYPDALEALAIELPRDPWGRAYLYTPPTPEHPIPDVYSLGADGLPGGVGPAEDIH